MRLIINAFISLGLATACAAQAENLDDIYRAALQNNPTLAGAEAQLKSKQEVANIWKGALLPTIGASISYGYGDNNSSTDLSKSVATVLGNVEPDTSSSSKGMQLSGQIGLTQALVDFYSWYSFKGAEQLSEQARLEFADTQQKLIINTVEQYLNVLRAKETLASSMAEENAILQRLEQTRQRYNVGLAAITEVHEAQATYDLSKVGRLASEGNLQIAYEALGLLTGKKHENIDNVSANYPIAPLAEDKDTWVKTAMDHNIDLLMANKGVEMSEFAVKAAKAQHYPTLSAGISYLDNTQSGKIEQSQYGGLISFADNNAESTSDSLAAGLTLEIPIYTGGATQASVRKAAAENLMATESVNGIKRSITQLIRALHVATMTRMEQVNARKQAIVSSQSALDAIQAGYDVGTRNIVDVLTAQRNLYAAQRDYANARFDYILSQFELKKAAGTLSPADIQSLNEWTTAENTAAPAQ